MTSQVVRLVQGPSMEPQQYWVHLSSDQSDPDIRYRMLQSSEVGNDCALFPDGLGIYTDPNGDYRDLQVQLLFTTYHFILISNTSYDTTEHYFIKGEVVPH